MWQKLNSELIEETINKIPIIRALSICIVRVYICGSEIILIPWHWPKKSTSLLAALCNCSVCNVKHWSSSTFRWRTRVCLWNIRHHVLGTFKDGREAILTIREINNWFKCSYPAQMVVIGRVLTAGLISLEWVYTGSQDTTLSALFGSVEKFLIKIFFVPLK